MTYIIAGRFKGSSFMMSDCIVTNREKRTFINKTAELESSSNTYYSLTGVQFIDNCVKCYDGWLVDHNKTNDFIDGMNSIHDLILVIDKMCDSYPDKDQLNLGENRLFFINKDAVVYYDLKYNNIKILEGYPVKKEVQMNFYIDSSIRFPASELSLEITSIENYCREHIHKLSKGIDFKDRFSFTEILENGKISIKHPYKYFSDIISIYNDIDYDKIDNDDFKWSF